MRFSHVSALYGSLSGAIVVLLGFELGAAVLLLGAQVIPEYERPSKKGKGKGGKVKGESQKVKGKSRKPGAEGL